MRIKSILLIVILSGIIISCGGPKVLTSNKNNAEIAMQQGNFKQAVELWKTYFNEVAIEETAGIDFAAAAKTAYKAGNSDLAISWFEQANYKYYADFEMYKTLAKLFRDKKNISKELGALEYIDENYPEKANSTNSRLFDVYFEIDFYEKALKVWKQLNKSEKNELPKLESYFIIQKSKENSAV